MTPPTTRILLCRHGETDWNREGRYQGFRDIPLNARGREQAEALGCWIAEVGLSIDSAAASPLARAADTARIIMRRQGVTRSIPGPALNLPSEAGIDPKAVLDSARSAFDPHIALDAGLREISHGSWEGRLSREFFAALPALNQAWIDAPHTVTWPEGDSLESLSARAVPAFEKLIRSHIGQSVLVAAHDAVNKALLLWTLGAPLSRFWSLRQDSTCLNVIDYRIAPDGQLHGEIVLLNSVLHTGHVLAELKQTAL